jgi:hypothetical protein
MAMGMACFMVEYSRMIRFLKIDSIDPIEDQAVDGWLRSEPLCVDYNFLVRQTSIKFEDNDK